MLVGTPTVLRELAAATLEVAGGDVVKHQRAVVEMVLGERRLDARLLLQQPVERGVDFALGHILQSERAAEVSRSPSPP
jgi:hypothetical protein